MTNPWSERWTPTGEKFRGGQGNSRAVQDGSGQKGFLKELRRQGDSRARARFIREVTSYQTLAGHGSLPNLLDHNADRWKGAEDLYLVIQLIDGETLSAWIRRDGPCNLDTALLVTQHLCDIVTFCHENDVVHRDLKPSNILIRGGDPADPVIVDFGLAFLKGEGESELTRVNEEVGNRFLRLPEHSTGGRSPISDIAQLVGVLYFLLTGLEPRVLVSDTGQMPHQRETARDLLSAMVLGDSQHRKLNSIFDRGLATMSSARFQTAAQLREALSQVMLPDPEIPSLDDLIAALDQNVTPQDRLRVEQGATNLQSFGQILRGSLSARVAQQNLEVSWGGGPNDFEADPPHALHRFALTVPGVIPRQFVGVKIELRDESDFVAIQDNLEIWRGSEASDERLLLLLLRDMVSHFSAGKAT